MENKKLEKLINNPKFLFIVPNLIYVLKLLHFYNENLKNGEVLFYEIIFIFLILFTITTIIYFFLKKALKEPKKIFCILCFITMFYSLHFNVISFLIFIAFILFLVLDFKKFICFNLDYIVFFISFIIITLFSYNFLIGIYNVSYLLIKSKGYDYKIDINIDNNTKTPNIYWIHCDGMIGTDIAKKYFNYNEEDLEKYFNSNQYIFNKEASLIAGHVTQKALVAMYNPYYYDNFFKEYLMDLEESYINPKDKPEFEVNYYEIEKKRLNNELFTALDKKGYSTIAIADFNHHTSFYTDYFYDYYVFDEKSRHLVDKKELRYMENNNSKDKLLSYIRFNHIRALLNTTFIYPLVEDINYLDYKIMDYNDINLKDYPNIDKTSYWNGKAILKSIEDSLKINNKKFVFIDYKLHHFAITYDMFGNPIDEQYMYNLNFYLGNYIYANNLLIELLDYIHDVDENAVIIVQADHGIHMTKENIMMKQLGITIEEVQDIRNSVISAYYIPEQYKNGDEKYLNNPLNVSRYLINNYIGKNYEYIE